jgi:hypothetical protein
MASASRTAYLVDLCRLSTARLIGMFAHHPAKSGISPSLPSKSWTTFKLHSPIAENYESFLIYGEW